MTLSEALVSASKFGVTFAQEDLLLHLLRDGGRYIPVRLRGAPLSGLVEAGLVVRVARRDAAIEYTLTEQGSSLARDIAEEYQ